jgi:hypothetical protein
VASKRVRRIVTGFMLAGVKSNAGLVPSPETVFLSKNRGVSQPRARILACSQLRLTGGTLLSSFRARLRRDGTGWKMV